jgi:hypothetical protein
VISSRSGHGGLAVRVWRKLLRMRHALPLNVMLFMPAMPCAATASGNTGSATTGSGVGAAALAAGCSASPEQPASKISVDRAVISCLL